MSDYIQPCQSSPTSQISVSLNRKRLWQTSLNVWVTSTLPNPSPPPIITVQILSVLISLTAKNWLIVLADHQQQMTLILSHKLLYLGLMNYYLPRQTQPLPCENILCLDCVCPRFKSSRQRTTSAPPSSVFPRSTQALGINHPKWFSMYYLEM